VIRQIAPNSAAKEAGLQVGDVITSFHTEPIRDFPHLVETVPLYRPGDAIPITINRSGSEFKVTVVLRRRGDS
jgi:S1-C subfamily serine protease